MSTYLDYIIEKNINGVWTFAKKAMYDDLDVPCPYILKGAMWDSDCYTSMATLKGDDLTEETILTFAQKLERVNIQDKGRWGYYHELALYNSDIYPYKYTPVFNLNEILYKTGTLKDSLIEAIGSLRKCISSNFADTIIGVNLDVIDENLEEFVTYINFKTTNLSEDSKLRQSVLDSKSIKPYLDQVENIIEYQGKYYWKFDAPYKALFFLRDYPLFQKDEHLLEKSLLPSYGTIHYYNEDKEVPQYELKYPPKISYPSDIENLLKSIDKDIKRVTRSQTAENVAKNIISGFLENAKHEDCQTDLGHALMEFVRDVEYEEDDDYLEELTTQKKEVETLLKEIGTDGRFIWNIS